MKNLIILFLVCFMGSFVCAETINKGQERYGISLSKTGILYYNKMKLNEGIEKVAINHSPNQKYMIVTSKITMGGYCHVIDIKKQIIKEFITGHYGCYFDNDVVWSKNAKYLAMDYGDEGSETIYIIDPKTALVFDLAIDGKWPGKIDMKSVFFDEKQNTVKIKYTDDVEYNDKVGMVAMKNAKWKWFKYKIKSSDFREYGSPYP